MYSPQIRTRLRRGVTVLTAILAALLCGLELAGSLDWLENRSSDWRVVATSNPARADRDIVMIDIDNASFKELTDQLGRWPWTRRLWTELVQYLAPGRPRLILFDILFSGAEPEADPGFAAAIRAAGNVILPFAFVSAEVDTELKSAPPEKALQSVTAPAGVELAKSKWSLNAPNLK